MKAEITVCGGDRSDGMFVKQEVTAAVYQNTKAVKRLNMALEFFARHHGNFDNDSLFTCLIKILILNIEW